MTFGTEFRSDFGQVIRQIGRPCRLRYFTVTHDDDDYDLPPGAGSLVQSGADTWVSGIILPVGFPTGDRSSTDALLMEQGRILHSDSRFYFSGDVSTSGIFDIGLGSPITGVFSVIADGPVQYEVDGTPIYKRVYARRLTNGSLFGA